MSNKPKIFWAVHDKKGAMQAYTIRWSLKDSIKEWENNFSCPWSEGKLYGWSVRKILISNFPEQ